MAKTREFFIFKNLEIDGVPTNASAIQSDDKSVYMTFHNGEDKNVPYKTLEVQKEKRGETRTYYGKETVKYWQIKAADFSNEKDC